MGSWSGKGYMDKLFNSFKKKERRRLRLKRRIMRAKRTKAI